MTPETYAVCLIITAAFLSYFGIYLLLGKTPTKQHKSAYHYSRKYMGAAFVLIAATIFIYFSTGMYNMPPYYRVALNITCYFIAAKLIATSFIILIGKKEKLDRLRYNHRLMIPIYIFPIATWSILLLNSTTLIIIALHVMAAILLISIILDIRYFFRQYRQTVENGEYYYAEGIGVHISWMIKSVYGIVAVGVSSTAMVVISPYAPKLILFVFLIAFVGVCMYIFNQFIHFTYIYSDLVERSVNSEQISEVELRKTNISEEIRKQIEQQITVWVEEKRYCENRINIETMAKHISTNRLYLSTYINTTHGCSFKSWISQLRVAESKRLILENPDMTITAIAEQVGFVSISSFTHAFKNIEGEAPKEWAAKTK